MAVPDASRATVSGGFYSRWLGPLLSQDEGMDAEQMSRSALTALGQASLRRRWPGVSTVLNGLASELQRRDLRLEQVLFGCRFANPVGLAAGFDKNGGGCDLGLFWIRVCRNRYRHLARPAR